MNMDKITAEYITVASERYGDYSLVKLKDVTAKEVRSSPALAEALKESFGERFVIVYYTAEGTREYVLSEHIIGIPTPEFERQLNAGEWKAQEIGLNKGDQ